MMDAPDIGAAEYLYFFDFHRYALKNVLGISFKTKKLNNVKKFLASKTRNICKATAFCLFLIYFVYCEA